MTKLLNKKTNSKEIQNKTIEQLLWLKDMKNKMNAFEEKEKILLQILQLNDTRPFIFQELAELYLY